MNVFFILQSLPAKESLNPEIALWIIGTLITVIISGVMFVKWMFKEAKKGISIAWDNVKIIHNEGIEQLKKLGENQNDIKSTQIRIETKLDGISQQVKETRYSQQTMSKLATEITVRKGGTEELEKLEESFKENA